MARLSVDDNTKRRFKRTLRRRRQDASEIGQQADQQIERLLIRRFDRLVSVRRFVFLWLALFGLLFFITIVQIRALSPYYQSLKPTPGGMYSEGLIGNFSTPNPIYATGTADVAVSRLIFSGLFKYDDSNKLIGDLAHSWVVDKTGKKYTVSIKIDQKWQDGQPVTADDVVFTYQLIQNPAALSPLYSSWQGITVTKDSKYSVSFILPDPLSSFPYALTNGILPKHLLKNTLPEQLRSANFNSAPIGTGPFKWRFVEVIGTSSNDRRQHITLAPNDDYWAGKPKLDGFSILTFNDEQNMVKAFKSKQINAMSGLEAVPEELAADSNIHVYNTPLTSAVMAFFNSSHSYLKDSAIRQALVRSVNPRQIISVLNYPAYPVRGPLLFDQVAKGSPAQLDYDLSAAQQAIKASGWTDNGSGLKVKDGKILELNLSAQDTPEYTRVAQELQKAWKTLGVKVTVKYYSAQDMQSQVIANHDYDILLYGISIGVDPDVFAYWDSSQADVSSQGHLNLSEYRSKAADQDLESARTRSDLALRQIKYKAFLSTWVQDAPALALYQPDYLYVSRGTVFGFERKADNASADRFYNVNNWMIRQQRQNN